MALLTASVMSRLTVDSIDSDINGMPTGSTRREAVKGTLLELEADGTSARITQQRFGRDGG